MAATDYLEVLIIPMAYKPEFEEKLFGIDVLGSNVSFKGWSDGSLWNGWDMPLFELDAAKRVLIAFIRIHKENNEPFQAWYDETEDAFCFILPDEIEPECYSAEVIEIGGKKLKVYPIGTGAWIWEE